LLFGLSASNARRSQWPFVKTLRDVKFCQRIRCEIVRLRKRPPKEAASTSAATPGPVRTSSVNDDGSWPPSGFLAPGSLQFQPAYIKNSASDGMSSAKRFSA
jgi:hypothetical protein